MLQDMSALFALPVTLQPKSNNKMPNTVLLTKMQIKIINTKFVLDSTWTNVQTDFRLDCSKQKSDIFFIYLVFILNATVFG